MNKYLELFITFFKIGAFSFGGGYAMIPLLTKEIVDNKKWCTNDELLDFYAIAQITPGVISVNVATFIGYKKEKTLGGIISTIGVITPSIIIILSLVSIINKINDHPIVIHALNGIKIAVAILMISAILKLFKQGIKTKTQILVYLLVLATVFFFDISSIYVVIILIGLGLVIKRE